MLTWFRARASGVAIVLFVSLGSLGLSVARPHEDDCHDGAGACFASAVVHDASAHRMRAETKETESQPLHCLVCHWARSFRPRGEVTFVAAPAVQAGIWIHVEIFTAPPAAPVAQPPLRSPPASPAFA
jgi:hypothetical protein